MEALDSESLNLAQLEQIEQVVRDPKASFFAWFNDGYHFRNLIEYLRGTNVEGNFLFTKDGISYTQSDANFNITNRLTIYASELIRYDFTAEPDYIILGISLPDLRNITKTIGRKDGLIMYKVSDDPLLYLQTVNRGGRGVGKGGLSSVRCKELDWSIYSFDGEDSLQHCFNVPADDFSSLCISIQSVKCAMVSIEIYTTGAKVAALNDNGILSRSENLGFYDGLNKSVEPDGQLVSTIEVRKDILKALTKINTLNNMDILKFSIWENLLQIECRICNYGILQIYIRNQSSESIK